jgi:hypothetical protein
MGWDSELLMSPVLHRFEEFLMCPVGSWLLLGIGREWFSRDRGELLLEDWDKESLMSPVLVRFEELLMCPFC